MEKIILQFVGIIVYYNGHNPMVIAEFLTDYLNKTYMF